MADPDLVALGILLAERGPRTSTTPCLRRSGSLRTSTRMSDFSHLKALDTPERREQGEREFQSHFAALMSDFRRMLGDLRAAKNRGDVACERQLSRSDLPAVALRLGLRVAHYHEGFAVKVAVRSATWVGDNAIEFLLRQGFDIRSKPRKRQASAVASALRKLLGRTEIPWDLFDAQFQLIVDVD